MNDSIIFIGDTHSIGKTQLLIEQYKITNCNLVHVGDFGTIGLFVESDLNKLNQSLKQNGNHLFVVRGNHDNPFYWSSAFNNDFNTHIHFVKDYEVLEIGEEKILCIGGAISVDRKKRIKDVDWFEDEKLVYRKVDSDLKPTIVVTHTSPIGFYPFYQSTFVLDLANNDLNLLTDLNQERNLLKLIFDQLDKSNLKRWIYGHFHKHVRGENENVTYLCLDINELYTLY